MPVPVSMNVPLPSHSLHRSAGFVSLIAGLLVNPLTSAGETAPGLLPAATASSIHAPGYPPEAVLDGDLQTRWASRTSGGSEWLQLDLGQALVIDELILHWEHAYPAEYTIEFSTDGQDWREARRETRGREGRVGFTGLGGRGRYLRVVGQRPGPFGLMSLWEVELPEPHVQAVIAAGRRAAMEARRARAARQIEGLRALGASQVVFAVRPIVPEHWYANFGYYAADGPSYFGNPSRLYRDGGRLCRLDLATGEVVVLLDDPAGGVRDPQVHYDGHTILFAYRPAHTEHYHLYEIQADGSGLRQLTSGAYDDIEPTYLPDGGIAFVSSRCKRWVNCWTTQVATLHRCDADGGNIRPLSSNNEHDNTPWPLPDGRILYTRWEYVDRSQVDYHHLWVVNPDGTGQMVFYGNLHPGEVMIDAKPIPGSDHIVACFSPGHGQTEHEGAVVLIDPRAGPDVTNAARYLTTGRNFRDPTALSENLFLAARGQSVVALDAEGSVWELYRLPEADVKAGLHCHEPRPLRPRSPEARMPARSRPEQPTGRLLLTDVREGRNMAGVAPGEIKKLLVLESLPKPINFTGGMDPLSYGGTFTLERILGTVPVESDGSAHFEVPALRSVFFVALDAKDLAVKRMQSFVTLQPGEVTGCAGCHEPRTQTPRTTRDTYRIPLAAERPASPIEPVTDCPDVLDFPRDVQPILNQHCVPCHDYTPTSRGGPYAGRLILSGDRGPMFSHAYVQLTLKRLFSDGRNEPRSNLPPRALGSAASRLLQLLDGSHYGVRLPAAQQQVLRLWIDTGAPYPGTYAALGSGMVGGYAQNEQVHTDFAWPTTKAAADVIARRCASCHAAERSLPRALADELGISFWRFELDDPRLRFSRHRVFNLSRPEQSLLLLAPLDRAAGGFGLCSTNRPVFGTPADSDYQALLAFVTAGRNYLESIKRFDMPDFQPRPEWVREMKRYGVIPAALAAGDPLDVYATEQQYWRSLWYDPTGSPPHAANAVSE